MYKIDSKNIDLINIGLALNGEKNLGQLLNLILTMGMEITSSDGGLIYLLDNEMLHYTLVQTKSTKLCLSNLVKSEIPMLPMSLTDNNIYTTAIRTKQIINIPNIRTCKEYDLSSCFTLDKKIHYQTQSMVIIPLFTNDNETLGVLQFMNCFNNKNRIMPYPSDIDFPLFYFATQSALSISNITYMQETKDLLYSFAEAMATAIDERAPYNSDHSRNVAKYIKQFIQYYNSQYKEGYVSEYFDESRTEQLYLAALLHDIGKLAIPIEIMNKSSRLASLLDPLIGRFEIYRCYFKIDLLEKRNTLEEYEQKMKELDQIQEFVLYINDKPYLDDATLKQVEKLKTYYYVNAEGDRIPYFSPAELECLSIRKGTLTNKERMIMENHVVVTSKMLSRFKFRSHYADIPKWANNHHEFLDGSGYPNHLTAKDMPLEIRMICICDIYDALTATDRPYKKPQSPTVALDILYQMANEGKLDTSLVLIFTDMIHSYYKIKS